MSQKNNNPFLREKTKQLLSFVTFFHRGLRISIYLFSDHENGMSSLKKYIFGTFFFLLLLNLKKCKLKKRRELSCQPNKTEFF